MGKDKRIRELEGQLETAMCFVRTFKEEHNGRNLICPKCGRYVLLSEYCCFGCGYDQTDLRSG